MKDIHRALVYTMVLASAADGEMSDAEFSVAGEVIKYFPVFKNFDIDMLGEVCREAAVLLSDNDGLDQIMQLVHDWLPDYLYETAYAIAVEIVAADMQADQEELRMLQILRHELELDRLVTSAIERGARARHMPVREDLAAA
ncbi:MAG: tellurite resistance TerB family protein [Alphaproteobacteria bacterium]